MKLLTDTDLKTYIDDKKEPLITGDISTNVWNTKSSAIQPCSVDLRIGHIQIPAEGNRKAKTITGSGKEYVLTTGQTAIVTTSEKLQMRKKFAGIGFPPSHVSIRGLLMTNPGHV